jgi:integrase
VGISVQYVQARKAGRLEYRRSFPEKLRAHIGQRELIASLKATSLADPGAMARYQAANDDYERLVATARKAVSGSFDLLDEARIAFLAETYKANVLAEDERERILGRVDRERHEANELGYGSELEDCSGPEITSRWGSTAVSIAAEQGWHFDMQTEAFGRLCRELLKATIAATEIQLARDAGVPVDTPDVGPAPAGRQPTQTSSAASVSFVSLAREALERTAFGFSATTKQATATASRFFEEVHGQLTPREITRAHVAEFIDLLAKCPAKRPFNERSWTLPKLVDAYDGKTFQPLAVKTMKQHVAMLSAVWAKLQDVGKIREGASNPFARHKFPKARRVEKEGFTFRELQTIIDLPLFTAGERPPRSKGEALYWIPLMLIFTGARPEEICQLLVTDIRQDPETAEWTLTITDAGEHPRKGQRRLKAGEGRRTFPIPRLLIELGLLDYRGWLLEAGKTALFPSLGTKGERKELYGGFTESWGAYLRKHNALTSGKLPSRDFRHTWTTEARRCRVPEDARAYIQGHAHPGQNTRYGSRSPLGDEIHNVTFDRLNLSRVRRWVAPAD